MPAIRLLALDMDGTLLDQHRKLSSENIQALRAAEEAGIIVCLASGRALSTMIPFRAQAGISGPVVTCNGAYTIDSNLTEVSHHGIDGQVSDRILAIGESYGVHINVYEKANIHVLTEGKYAEIYAARTGVAKSPGFSKTEKGLSPTKILFMQEPDVISDLATRLAEEVRANEAVIVRSEADYLEFLPPGINKGVGVARIASHLGIRQSEVAALGDYENDIEMLEYAGYAGAMSNAIPRAKEVANVVVGHHNESGAAEFIHSVIKLSLAT